MRKIVMLLVMILTVVWTIPSISITETDIINMSFPDKQAATKVEESIPKALSPTPVLPEEGSGNTTNRGLAEEDNEKIYYSDGTALWSMYKDGTFKTKIIDKAYPTNIQVFEDTIYYINQQTEGIHKVNKDGTDGQRIGDDKAYSINIYNRRIYFMDRYNNLHITAMSLEGKDKQVIKEVVANDMMIYNDYIYYITRSGNLCKVRVDGANDTVIKTGVMQYDVAKTGIYYTYDPRKDYKPKGLYHLDFEQRIETSLLSETPYSFNVDEDFIYYNHPIKLSLHSMKQDGTQKTELTGTNTTQINIGGDYIYYRNLEDSKKVYRINKDGANRVSLDGKTLISNVTDLSKEFHDLNDKEMMPKLQRSYRHALEITDKLIKADMTDYEKIKAVHDYVIDNTRYDIEASDKFLNGEDSDANSFMAYGVFINQKAVCQGYAEAVQILLSLAGIESDLVIGDSRPDPEEDTLVPHMWNLVKLDNEYYMLDATWDDPVGPKDIISYEFFLIDSETLSKTHIWAQDEYPVCDIKFNK